MSSVVISGDTSGSITLSAPAVSGSSVLTLPVATDTLAGIAATQTLTNKSIVATQLTGTIAAARLPAGSVLQVIQSHITGKASTSSTSKTILATSASITPSSASNKIKFTLFTIIGNDGATGNADFDIIRTVGATNTTMAGSDFNKQGTTDAYQYDAFAWSGLDTPATTSAVTYSIRGVRTDGLATPFVGGRATDSSYTSPGVMFILEEVAA